jgi:hypothetical protein
MTWVQTHNFQVQFLLLIVISINWQKFSLLFVLLEIWSGLCSLWETSPDPSFCEFVTQVLDPTLILCQKQSYDERFEKHTLSVFCNFCCSLWLGLGQKFSLLFIVSSSVCNPDTKLFLHEVQKEQESKSSWIQCTISKKLTITLWAHHHFFSPCGPPGTLCQVQETGNYVAAKQLVTSTKFIAKMNIRGGSKYSLDIAGCQFLSSFWHHFQMLFMPMLFGDALEENCT